jgi:hypothetical protein
MNNLLYSYDYLVDVFLVYQLPILEALQHVIDKLFGYFFLKANSIIACINCYTIDIKTLGR